MHIDELGLAGVELVAEGGGGLIGGRQAMAWAEARASSRDFAGAGAGENAELVGLALGVEGAAREARGAGSLWRRRRG